MSQPKTSTTPFDINLFTEKTLDEVIVAYLAEDDTPTLELPPVAVARESTQPLTQADLEAIRVAGEAFLAATGKVEDGK